MKELIEEYFKRDLSEAEEQKLADYLASSPEEAERFAQSMGDFYKGLGLSEPTWPGGTAPIQKSFAMAKWLLLLALLPAGYFFYQWQTGPQALPQAIPEASVQPMENIQPAPAQKPKVREDAQPKKITKTQASQKEVSFGQTQAQAPAVNGAEQTQSLAQEPPPALPSLSAEPSGAAQSGQGREVHRLTVSINRTKSGLATVRVVDEKGNLVRNLYSGILPAGNRSFTWDGRTDEGAIPLPGRYFLEMKSGSDIQRRELDFGAAK